MAPPRKIRPRTSPHQPRKKVMRQSFHLVSNTRNDLLVESKDRADATTAVD
jgi:hypothetical protein